MMEIYGIRTSTDIDREVDRVASIEAGGLDGPVRGGERSVDMGAASGERPIYATEVREVLCRSARVARRIRGDRACDGQDHRQLAVLQPCLVRKQTRRERSR